MPNLLKSLPKEILEKEDSKFIYNVLNPLLFDKVRESMVDTTVTHKVRSLLEKDIKYNKMFLPEFRIPFNINSRELHVYMSDGQEKTKLKFFGEQELLRDFDDLKYFVFFYFGVEGYGFLYEIMVQYYSITAEYEKSKKSYLEDYKKYIAEPDVRKKKIYKSSYEFFKKTFDGYSTLKEEFDLVILECFNYLDFSSHQLVDNFAINLANRLKLKTFDNEIIFEHCTIFSYLEKIVKYDKKVKKHVYSGKNIISTTEIEVNTIYELISFFAMEISSIKEKYDTYLKFITDNGMGYSLELSDQRKIKNTIYENLTFDLGSDNLTYVSNIKENKLEVYIYFSNGFRLNENEFKISINNDEIPSSICSLKGNYTRGYTIFEYFDDTSKYFKVTIHDFFKFDVSGKCTNLKIDSIEVSLEGIISTQIKLTDLHIETVNFIDNFKLYAKNKDTGFYEELFVPYKLKIDISEKDEHYIRTFDFVGLNVDANHKLLESDIVVSFFEFDYVYEPKLYVDFFNHFHDEVNFRYNTIIPYVLIDDVYGEDFELSYFDEVKVLDFNSNVKKHVKMYDGRIYQKMFDVVDYKLVMNPYNEKAYELVSKISYSTYQNRSHVNKELIQTAIKKIPFKDNLRLYEKIQMDAERGMIIFVQNSIQKAIPVSEGLKRGLNIENFEFDSISGKISYCGFVLRSEDFIFVDDKIYLKNKKTDDYDLLEAIPTEQINTPLYDNQIFFDEFEMAHCVFLKGKKYLVGNLFVDGYENAMKNKSPVMYVESKYGIPRFKTDESVVDVDFSKRISNIHENHEYHAIVFDEEKMVLMYRYGINDVYEMPLGIIDAKPHKHRLCGISAFSMFYAGNVLPENSNKMSIGRENIYGSMSMPDNVYSIGKNLDRFKDEQNHALLAEQLDLVYTDAGKYDLEQEPYIMFKSKTASFKGLESYLKTSLKVISNKIDVSPVYLIQRNRYISEWTKVSGVQPDSYFGGDTLKELVADLMETKLINHKFDDLMTIFKNNEYERFSLDTNNIHNVLVQYIMQQLGKEKLLENFTYYLIHEIWMKKSKRKVTDYIREHASQTVIREMDELTFETFYEQEKFFYMFVNTMSSVKKETISSYLPISNYSDWTLYLENNDTKFNKPYRYEVIDISDFITMSVEWEQPLLMIRPLTEDHVFVKRDFRFLDLSIITHSEVTYNDVYNEYAEKIKNSIDKLMDYTFETLSTLKDLSITGGFDFLGVNLVVVKWIVERFLPTYLTNNSVDSVEEFREAIKTELLSAEHPNLIVSYNKIKESTLLGDLGKTVKEIFGSITTAGLIKNNVIRLNVSSPVELEKLDKIKKPLEHYFDYLFFAKRHDIVAKILALFTEDVIASSMLDLSLAINLKHSKGDSTFNIYENMVYEIFDEFLPFHTVLDKLIFVFNVMESSSSEAMGKELSTAVMDTHLIDVFSKFVENIKIQTVDRHMLMTNYYMTSERMMMCGGGYDELPYDYDRSVQVGGMSIAPQQDDDETYGIDDEFFVINKKLRWKSRVADVYEPPYFADYIGECGPTEKIVDTYIDDFYKIKIDIFNRDDRISSYFVDSIPLVAVGQDDSEILDSSLIENYLIHIESLYKVELFDMDLLAHGEYGVDDFSGPSSQSTLIGMHDLVYQNIIQDFYDKINVVILDSIWTDVVIVYDLYDVPGHDEFAIDENYHQQTPLNFDNEISTMVYDDLLKTGFDTNIVDMMDISLVDKRMALKVAQDETEFLATVSVSDGYYLNIGIITNRNFDKEGRFIRPGHDEFAYDEYYHNSVDENRADNMTDVKVVDYFSHVRIDFGFMRMLPFDPYASMIDKKFYRSNLPGSDFQSTVIRDRYIADIHSFSKDIIRVGMMDLYSLDYISNEFRNTIYDSVTNDMYRGDFVPLFVSDSIKYQNIGFDFREHIIAIDKFAGILNDSDILNIYGLKGADFERDELFKIEFEERYNAFIKIKSNVDRVMTRVDKDYLKSIKVEEENFVEFKYLEREISVRFKEMLTNYVSFKTRVSLNLTESDRLVVDQFDQEKVASNVLDKVLYGHLYSFEIDGMTISVSDELREAWSNKIHRDSLILLLTDENDLRVTSNDIYGFGDERVNQAHDMFGHMGYTDQTLERSIESRFKDSLIQHSDEMYFELENAKVYDYLMTDIGFFYGDVVNTFISDSLNTYVHIVKKPWIFPEFDLFGHDEQRHMYNGDSDEFDITTQLREMIRQDAYLKVYENDALVRFFESINIGYLNKMEFDTISASLVDDLKVIDEILFGYDVLNVGITDNLISRINLFDTKMNIGVSDKIWYGYKFKDDSVGIITKDSIYYKLEEDVIKQDDRLYATVRDWLLLEYKFIDDKAKLTVTDNLKHIGYGIKLFDEINLIIKETLDWEELIDLNYIEKTKVYISDRLIFDKKPTVDFFAKDALAVSLKSGKLTYGPGKELFEKVIVNTKEQFYSDTYFDFFERAKIDANISDIFHINTFSDFRDSLELDTYERMKFGPIFRDKLNIQLTGVFGLHLRWLDDRYGVDFRPHDDWEMEYYNGSSERSFDAEIKDDLKIIDVRRSYGDYITTVIADKLKIGSEFSDIPSIGTVLNEKVLSSIVELSHDVKLSWRDDRHLHDESFHDIDGMEYYNDSVERTFTANTNDDVKLIELHLSFFEALNILTNDAIISESSKSSAVFDIKFKDSIRGLLTEERLGVGLNWSDGRYGVDEVSHNELELGYYSDSLDRALGVGITDNINVLDTHLIFGESLIILSDDQLSTFDSEGLVSESIIDGIFLVANEKLSYGVGYYDYVWDSKEWEKFGYSVPYEDYKGLLPHDELPYDYLEHSEQGNDLSRVSTGLVEKLVYEFNLLFKDTLNVTQTDEKHILEHWEYQSLFKDKSQVQITSNIEISNITNTMHHESMKTSYVFADVIKNTPDYFGKYSTTEVDYNTQQYDYYSYAVDNNLGTVIGDDIMILDTLSSISDSLLVSSSDRINSGVLYSSEIDSQNIGVVETFEYGFGIKNTMWDSEMWNEITKREEIDTWVGLIPHDDIPYGEFGHSLQGDDLSIIDISLFDDFDVWFDLKFTDKMSIKMIENTTTFDVVTKLNDRLVSMFGEMHGLGLYWLNTRFGIDDFSHDEKELEYYEDSATRAIQAEFKDSIKVVDQHLKFVDTLSISLDTILTTNENVGDVVQRMYEGIIVISKDSIEYGNGKMFNIWSSKLWREHGYDAMYEDWIGKIPHDDFPYDSLEHDQQGEDLSITTASMFDSVHFDLSFKFKETIAAKMLERLNIQASIYQKEEHILNLIMVENVGFRLVWPIDRYGIDSLIHDTFAQEYLGDSAERIVATETYDCLDSVVTHFNFRDNITAKLKTEFYSGLNLKTVREILNTTVMEKINIGLIWSIERIGLDSLSHDEMMHEYLYGTENQSIGVGAYEGIEKIDIVTNFKDKLGLSTYENIVIGELYQPEKENLIVLLKDTVSYGVGIYDYVWDANEWNTFGNSDKVNSWVGRLPHDHSGYDDLEHDSQGDDLSHITTGVYDSLAQHLEIRFYDSLNVMQTDKILFSVESLLIDSSIKILSFERFNVGLLWPVERYAVDSIEHDTNAMGFIGDSEEQTVSSLIYDDVNLLNINFKFNESLGVFVGDLLNVSDEINGLVLNLSFKDYINVSQTEKIKFGALWLNDKYGVDEVFHDDGLQGYFGDSVDRSVSVYPYDDIVKIDSHFIFGESLTILPKESFEAYFGYGKGDVTIESKTDGIVIVGIDTLMYGVGTFDYVWDAKAWDKHGYEIPYENWSGQIPHDESPYDMMGHSEQGDDLSVISTGVRESFVTIMNLNFFENVKAISNDSMKYGFGILKNDSMKFTLSENFDVRLLWLDKHFGVDDFSHDEKAMEYYDDSVDQSFNVSYKESFKMLVKPNIFREYLTISMKEKIEIDELYGTQYDNITISSKEFFITDVGVYDYIWDALDWNKIGYIDSYESKYSTWVGRIPHDEIPYDEMEHDIQADDISVVERTSIDDYERWVVYGNVPDLQKPFDSWLGRIPHDEIPYGEMGHDEQGGDLSILTTGVSELLTYGYNIKFVEVVGISLSEKFTINPDVLTFNEWLNIGLLEEIRYDSFTPWLVKRTGDIESIYHDEGPMGYYGESVDFSISSLLNDDIKMFDITTFIKEGLRLQTTEHIGIDVDYCPNEDTLSLVVIEEVKQFIKQTEYMWDEEAWELQFNGNGGENWKGLIPHDALPHDLSDHLEQGDDLSVISTGVGDYLLYQVDSIFKDSVKVDIGEQYFDYWVSGSKFSEKIHLTTMLRNESMTVSYYFDDKIKTHKFLSYDNSISREEIDIFDEQTYQLIEAIIKYRLYEGIDSDINDDILSTALFKYDEELSLITDYKTKIDLFKAEESGRITKSMTLIKDKTSAKIELLFIEGLVANASDSLYYYQFE